MTVVDKDIGNEVTVLSRESKNRYISKNDDGESILILTTRGFTLQIPDSEVVFIYELQDGDTVPAAPSNGASKDSGLTPEEAAVAGTHTYSQHSPQFPNEEVFVMSYTITFSPGSAVIRDTNGLYWIFGVNEVYLERIGENLYSYAPSGNDPWGTVTFTDEGFTTVWTEDGYTTIRTLQD